MGKLADRADVEQTSTGAAGLAPALALALALGPCGASGAEERRGARPNRAQRPGSDLRGPTSGGVPRSTLVAVLELGLGPDKSDTRDDPASPLLKAREGRERPNEKLGRGVMLRGPSWIESMEARRLGADASRAGVTGGAGGAAAAAAGGGTGGADAGGADGRRGTCLRAKPPHSLHSPGVAEVSTGCRGGS